MIKQEFILQRRGWKIVIYYEVTSFWSDVVMEDLRRIGITGKQRRIACSVTKKSDLDTGLTFSNYDTRETIVVVCNGSKAAEFFNSLVHELSHVQRHICEADAIDPYSEESAYIIGDLAAMVYPKIHHLLCGCHGKREEVTGNDSSKAMP